MLNMSIRSCLFFWVTAEEFWALRTGSGTCDLFTRESALVLVSQRDLCLICCLRLTSTSWTCLNDLTLCGFFLLHVYGPWLTVCVLLQSWRFSQCKTLIAGKQGYAILTNGYLPIIITKQYFVWLIKTKTGHRLQQVLALSNSLSHQLKLFVKMAYSFRNEASDCFLNGSLND